MRSSLADDEPPGRVDCLINNLNDAVTLGLFPILFSTHHLSLTQIGLLGALFLGHCAAWYRGLVRPHRPQVADQHRHCWCKPAPWHSGQQHQLRAMERRGRPARARYRDGLPNPAPRSATSPTRSGGPSGRCLPALARCRVGPRRAARGSDRGPVGPHYGGLGRGRAHRRVRIDRRRSHVRDHSRSGPSR
jgi:hypothetical protein